MNAWDHLPNAKHIDWVIDSVKQHPEVWAAVRDAAWNTAWYAAWEVAKDAGRGAARNAAWYATRDAGWDVILALVAYDDCAHLLDMSGEQLKTWATLSEQPAAVLLLSAVIAREQIRELEQA